MQSTNDVVSTGAAVRRVSWGAIFAGSAVTLALMVLFTTLGLAIGAATVDPLYEDISLSGLAAGSGIYVVVTQLLSLAAGGFVAARLAGVPRILSAIFHGATLWAVATLLLAWAAIAGGGAIFGAASTIVGNTARAAANVVESVVPDDFSFPDIAEIASEVSIQDLPPEIQDVFEENGITINQLRTEATDAFREVVSQQEQERALNILTRTLGDALRTPDDIGTDVNDAIDNLVGGPDAVFSEEDRQEIISVLEQRLGITPEDVEQVVDAIEANVEQAIDDLRVTLDQIQQDALEVAQSATSALATTATWLTIASALGLAAAAGGAFAGMPGGLLGRREVRHSPTRS